MIRFTNRKLLFILPQIIAHSCFHSLERDTCILPALAGECHNYVERWYYNTNEKRCRPFYYGGCGGNDNNFANQEACLHRCEKPQTTPAPQHTEFRRGMLSFFSSHKYVSYFFFVLFCKTWMQKSGKNYLAFPLTGRSPNNHLILRWLSNIPKAVVVFLVFVYSSDVQF